MFTENLRLILRQNGPPACTYICTTFPQNAAHAICHHDQCTNTSLPCQSSIKIVPIHLPAHDHHPDQKDRGHDLERERRLPHVADRHLRQIRQRLHRHPGIMREIVAIGVDVGGRAVQLDRGLDQAGQPEYEEDEGADEDEARDEESARREEEEYQPEEEGE